MRMQQTIRVLFRETRGPDDPPVFGVGLRVGLYQGAGPAGDAAAVEWNLRRLDQACALASEYSCHIVVFPELYPTGYALRKDAYAELAEPSGGAVISRVRETARRHGTAVLMPYAEADAGRVFDTAALIAADGDLLLNYRKSHLYGLAEREAFTAGDELPPVTDLNGITTGVLLCYECEFPPLYQHLSLQGARIVLGPTAADRHYRLADGTRTHVPYPDATEHIIPAMAQVWRLFIAYANRRGTEHSQGDRWEYRANSGIWAPSGQPLVATTADDAAEDCLLIADCVPDSVPPFSPEGDHRRDSRLETNASMRPQR
jgi:predicted amidohydrolase